jgi:glycosyltransferase involved in cell wall biosynthesis
MSPVELQSITTLEALASGVPIVAVQAGALPELVSDGINGRLVAPGDWQAASAALEDVLSNEERRNVMGAASRNKAKAHDLQLSIAQYEQVLQGAAPRCRGDRIRERSTAAGR